MHHGVLEADSNLYDLTPPLSVGDGSETAFAPSSTGARLYFPGVDSDSTVSISPVPALKTLLDSSYGFNLDGVQGEIPHRVYALETTSTEDNIEFAAVKTTAAFLAGEGAQEIVVIGGPGRPDMVSLGGDGELLITEIKGTKVGTRLAQAGLLRIGASEVADPLTGELGVFENSPAWLRRSGLDVVRRLQEAERNATVPSQRDNLHELVQRYSEAVASGFAPGSYRTDLFQIGFLPGDQELEWASPSPMTHAFCAEVRPERIVQVQVQVQEPNE